MRNLLRLATTLFLLIFIGTAWGQEKTNDNDSEALAPDSQIGEKTISSLYNTYGDAENVFIMDIWDWGTDGLPTKVTNIRIKPYTTNTADWTDNIQGVFIDDGENYITPNSTTIEDTYIDMTFTVDQLTVPNEDVIEVTVYIYLNTSNITDESVLSFMVDADDSGFTAVASGSGFANPLYEDFNSNDMTIDVEASELQFKQQPTNVQIGQSILPVPTVAFTDENGNVDNFYDGADIDMTSTGSLIGTLVSTTSFGVATFSSLQFSTSGTGVTLTATDKDNYLETNASINSNAFDVIELPKVFFSEYIEGSSHNKAIEIYNGEATDIDLSDYTINIYNNGGSAPSNTWTGSTTLASNKTFIIYDSQSGTTITRKGNVTAAVASFSGNDALELVYDGTTLDIFGVIGTNPGTGWSVAGTSNATVSHTLVRKLSTTSGNTNWASSAGTTINDSEWEIFTEDHFYNLGVFGTGWSGATDNYWATSTNWDVKIPDANTNVLINSEATTQSTISSAATCNDITIESGASLIGSENLTVSGEATMQRTINEYTADENGWHLLSSPVNNMTIVGSDFEPGTATPNLDDFYGWDEVNNLWLNQKVGANNITNFVNGTGYLVAYQATETKDFTGTFNNSDITFTNLSKTAGNGDGWHLVGNPFQSALQWTATDWVRTNIGAGAKVMNNGGGYTDIVIGGAIDIIPANQGFFIEATADNNNTFTIPKSQRVHSTTAFYKNEILNSLTLKAIDGNYYQESWVQFMDGSTEAYDAQYDVRFMSGMAEAPQMYSICGDEYLSTNRISAPADEATIPFGFNTESETTITIEATGVGSFSENYEILLEDVLENTLVDLRENPTYTFESKPEFASERFLLHFNYRTGVSQNPETASFKVFASSRNIYTIDATGEVEVFDLAGRRVAVTTINESTNCVARNLTPGAYIVKSANGTEKVIVQ